MRNTTQIAIIALLVFRYVGASSAEEYPVENYHNYYFNEGQHDWAKNCRITAVLPAVGSSFPASIRLGFKFDRDVGGAGYLKGTSFDLAIRRPGSAWEYHQLRRPRTISGNASTVIFTDPITVNLAPNSSIAILFEMYGDCDSCSWPEGYPPATSVTTWRIFGEIYCESAAGGTVARCEIRNFGSAQPAKQLGSINPHNPSHFPQRVLPRPQLTYTAQSDNHNGVCSQACHTNRRTCAEFQFKYRRRACRSPLRYRRGCCRHSPI